METDINFEQVKKWVSDNTDNTEAMDYLNKITYPFTSNWRDKRNEVGKNS